MCIRIFFLFNLNLIVSAFRGWIAIIETGTGALLTVGRAAVTAARGLAELANFLGAKFDVESLERLEMALGEEAEAAFERAREAAGAFNLTNPIKQTKALKSELEKLGSTVDTLAGLEDLPIDISKGAKAKKIPGARTVDFQKAQQDALEAQEKLKLVAQQTNQA
ncbi:MAG: hypothetical protein IIC74_09070, partial [Bacteroidetes bacterium]|nr:hypothetical protein [Bacteroidota bacterium]